LEFPHLRRDAKPRLKPGFTFTRLLLFLVVFVVLAVVAKHFVEGKYPSGDCGAKGIDTRARNEGTCTEDGSTIVVVDKAGVLKLRSLEAKLLGLKERKTIGGPGRSKTTKGEFITAELKITNQTDTPARVGPGQITLYLRELHLEAFEAEEDFEPRSFLARDQAIPPQGSEVGTVTFGVSSGEAAMLTESGNLDFLNFGSAVSIYEPEGLFDQSERGTIRTYQ
jgi:hypothetical protein